MWKRIVRILFPILQGSWLTCDTANPLPSKKAKSTLKYISYYTQEIVRQVHALNALSAPERTDGAIKSLFKLFQSAIANGPTKGGSAILRKALLNDLKVDMTGVSSQGNPALAKVEAAWTKHCKFGRILPSGSLFPQIDGMDSLPESYRNPGSYHGGRHRVNEHPKASASLVSALNIFQEQTFATRKQTDAQVLFNKCKAEFAQGIAGSGKSAAVLVSFFRDYLGLEIKEVGNVSQDLLFTYWWSAVSSQQIFLNGKLTLPPPPQVASSASNLPASTKAATSDISIVSGPNVSSAIAEQKDTKQEGEQSVEELPVWAAEMVKEELVEVDVLLQEEASSEGLDDAEEEESALLLASNSIM